AAQWRAHRAGRRGRALARDHAARRAHRERSLQACGRDMSAPEAPSASGSPFWRFSLRLYRRPEAVDACIALQEEAGVDVNLLLFLLWQGTLSRALSAAEVAELERRIGPWRNATVVPLRALRRALKSPPELVAPATSEHFRTRIKAAQLEAQ